MSLDSPQSVPSPAAIMQFLDSAAGDLDSLGKELESAHIALGDAETTYEGKLDDALLEIVDEYERAGERLPGAETRMAMARKRIDFEIYVEAKKALRLVEALKARIKAYEAAVNARQSTLRGLQFELQLESRR